MSSKLTEHVHTICVPYSGAPFSCVLFSKHPSLPPNTKYHLSVAQIQTIIFSTVLKKRVMNVNDLICIGNGHDNWVCFVLPLQLQHLCFSHFKHFAVIAVYKHESTFALPVLRVETEGFRVNCLFHKVSIKIDEHPSLLFVAWCELPLWMVIY